MRSANHGFTIVEVLISIALLGILVTAILLPIMNSYKMTGQSKLNLQATADAQKRLEHARQVVLANYSNGAAIGTALSDPEFVNVVCENLTA